MYKQAVKHDVDQPMGKFGTGAPLARHAAVRNGMQTLDHPDQPARHDTQVAIHNLAPIRGGMKRRFHG